MPPTCSNCGATDFVWANELKTGGGLSGTGTLSLRPRGETPLGTRICRSCGHADLFLRDLSLLHKPHTWKPGEFVPIQGAKPAAKAEGAHHASSHSGSPAPAQAAPPPPPPPPVAPAPPPPTSHSSGHSHAAAPPAPMPEESAPAPASAVEIAALSPTPPESAEPAVAAAPPPEAEASPPKAKAPRKRAAKKPA